ncbi:hypothetical protein HGRIS_003583 [Hohenbuehelia grisea]|uniref:Protein kinase domain-containing protein n=1 Tax=Hohenbuehelia grisea TaxID=104357 RepID=A0ABR3JGT4_9AGAR
MELIHGANATKFCKRPPVSIERSLMPVLAEALAEALFSIHDLDVMHTDFDLRNIMFLISEGVSTIESVPEIVVVDFNGARPLSSDPENVVIDAWALLARLEELGIPPEQIVRWYSKSTLQNPRPPWLRIFNNKTKPNVFYESWIRLVRFKHYLREPEFKAPPEDYIF